MANKCSSLSTPDVQRFILEKLKQGYAWETASHMRHLLSKVLGTAKVRQSLLGHSTAAITMDVYTHPVSESERHAVARLNEILFPNVPNLHQDAAGVETGRVVTMIVFDELVGAWRFELQTSCAQGKP